MSSRIKPRSKKNRTVSPSLHTDTYLLASNGKNNLIMNDIISPRVNSIQINNKHKSPLKTPSKSGRRSKQSSPISTHSTIIPEFNLSNGNLSDSSNLSTISGSTTSKKSSKSTRRRKKNTTNGHSKKNNNISGSEQLLNPKFQFKIGMDVGVSLGDCYLQLQKLENSVSKLTSVSDDIRGVMLDLSQYELIPPSKKSLSARSSPHISKQIDVIERPQSVRNPVTLVSQKKPKTEIKKSGSNPSDDISPVEEILYMTDLLEKWQRDGTKRILHLNKSLATLQATIENMDEANDRALNLFQNMQEMMVNISNQSFSSGNSKELNQARKHMQLLKEELTTTKLELSDKSTKLNKLKKTFETKMKNLADKEKELEEREKQLDEDAEAISKQARDLASETQRLLQERQQVQETKEKWDKMINEHKKSDSSLKQREDEIRTQYEKLVSIHESIADEKKKLLKQKKKISKKERKLAKLNNKNNNNNNNNYFNGSEYAESEYAETVVSDGMTEIQSVDSFDDDLIERLKNEREQLNNLQLPLHNRY